MHVPVVAHTAGHEDAATYDAAYALHAIAAAEKRLPLGDRRIAAAAVAAARALEGAESPFTPDEHIECDVVTHI
jgi:hypothetical protein